MWLLFRRATSVRIFVMSVVIRRGLRSELHSLTPSSKLSRAVSCGEHSFYFDEYDVMYSSIRILWKNKYSHSRGE